MTRPFRHEAESRGLSFEVQVDPVLRSITTDSKRLQQVLKNLLSNAFKFTEHGGVRMSISAVTGGWSSDHPMLNHAPTVVAFEVSDTGIGIQPEKQRIIFEAFQQADASTSRKYGGTGLGLAISRELSNLLGGEIQLRSKPGVGSTFTLYLPLAYIGPASMANRSVASASSPQADVALPSPVRLVERPIDSSRRPTDHRAGGCRAADRGGRSALCARPGRSGARPWAEGAGRDAGRGCTDAGARVSAHARCRSMCSCPTCWVGRC